MRKIAWLFVSCLVCLSLTSCTSDEGSDEAATAEPPAEAAEAPVSAPAVPIAGTWQITEWHVDQTDQMEMWRVGEVMVEFNDDGSIESQLTYDNGDERTSKGTWKRDGDKLEIHIKGGGEEEGDHPFERTREFTIDELSTAGFTVRSEIPAKDRPIVLTYKAKRMP